MWLLPRTCRLVMLSGHWKQLVCCPRVHASQPGLASEAHAVPECTRTYAAEIFHESCWAPIGPVLACNG